MKRTLLMALMASLTIFSIAQTQSVWADRAYTYMEQDSLKQAEECFKKAIEVAPQSKQSAKLLANLGTIQRQRGKVREAIETYTTALERAPLDPKCRWYPAGCGSL